MKNIEHFDFPILSKSELRKLELIPYRTNKELVDKVHYIFSHPYNTHNKLYSEVRELSKYQLPSRMANVAVAHTRYFLDNQQQFGSSFDNIHLQILTACWKETFFYTSVNKMELDRYYSTKMKLVSIENGFLELLLETCHTKNYIQHGDDIVKRRTGVGLRERKLGYSEKQLNYLCSLD